MHLEGPWLSLNGKRKGKVKFRNAEEARRARELAEEWNTLKSKWAVPNKEKRVGKIFEPYRSTSTTNIRDTGPRPPSLNPADMRPAPKNETKVYTGTKIIGIGTMHKSNSVPIFSNDEAHDIAHMRR
jgi:hypothetical protein